MATDSTRLILFGQLVRSQPFQTAAVDTAYYRELGRLPSAAEQDEAVADLAAGHDLRDVEAALYGSDEYWNRRGGRSPDTYVRALYQGILGRAPTTPELALGLRELKTGSRSQVVHSIFDSREADVRTVQSYYRRCIGSPGVPESVGRAVAVLADSGEIGLIRYLQAADPLITINRILQDDFNSSLRIADVLKASAAQDTSVWKAGRFWPRPPLTETKAFDYRAWLQAWENYLFTIAHPILDTDVRPWKVEDVTGAGLDGNNPNWASLFCGGQTFLLHDTPQFEWEPLFNKTLNDGDEWGPTAGLSGWAVAPQLSGNDIPFTHPFANDDDYTAITGICHPWARQDDQGNCIGEFGTDFTFGIVPDSLYGTLLAPADVDLSGSAYWMSPEGDLADELADLPSDIAPTIKVPGALHTEIDQGLLPRDYRPRTGDRVAAFGRWVVDAGHDNFQTELHPLSAIAVARPMSPDETVSTIIAAPFMTSQVFGTDNNGAPVGLRGAIIGAFGGRISDWVNNQVWNAGNQIGRYWNSPVNLDTHILTGLPGGPGQVCKYTLRPPSPRRNPGDKLLVSWHFETNTGVRPFIFSTPGSDEVQVWIWTTPDYQPAWSAPSGSHVSIITGEGLLSVLSPGDAGALRAYLTDLENQARGAPVFGGDLANYIHKLVWELGIAMTWWDAPIASAPNEGESVRTDVPANTLGFSDPVTDISETEPFPVYGFVKLRWERSH